MSPEDEKSYFLQAIEHFAPEVLANETSAKQNRETPNGLSIIQIKNLFKAFCSRKLESSARHKINQGEALIAQVEKRGKLDFRQDNRRRKNRTKMAISYDRPKEKFQKTVKKMKRPVKRFTYKDKTQKAS